MDEYIVAAERLGWPRERRWRFPLRLLEVQTQMAYEDSPDEPTATCHLQRSDEESALCGFQWEGLVAVPQQPAWESLHPMMRCDSCEAAAGIEREDPADRDYKFRWD